MSKTNEDDPPQNERIFTLPEPKPKKSKKVTLKKEQKKRIITQKDGWNDFVQKFQDHSFESIIQCLKKNDSEFKILLSHIKSKIRGYYGQDKDKNLVDNDKFVKLENVLDLMETSHGLCHYCKSDVLLVYEYVRDTKQWTLERKDNSKGHNHDNVVLACLNCNIKRKCMKMERYEMTKLLAHIEKINS